MQRADIQKALKMFDQQFRPLPEWVGWEKKRSQKCAVAEAGKLYPPKRIISIATGTPVNASLQSLVEHLVRADFSRPSTR